MSSLIHIGYFPKKVIPRPDWLEVARVHDIRSVSNCMSGGPEGWMSHWTHNDLWVYSTIAAALAVVPESERGEYEVHAYRMLPMKWNEGTAGSISLPNLEVEPLPSDYRSVGFDVVSIEEGVEDFGHSPLSCNHMATEIETNEHCLIDDLEVAKQTAAAFSKSSSGVEPGPYYVVEVLCRPTG